MSHDARTITREQLVAAMALWYRRMGEDPSDFGPRPDSPEEWIATSERREDMEVQADYLLQLLDDVAAAGEGTHA